MHRVIRNRKRLIVRALVYSERLKWFLAAGWSVNLRSTAPPCAEQTWNRAEQAKIAMRPSGVTSMPLSLRAAPKRQRVDFVSYSAILAERQRA